MKILTASQMREVDRRTIELGIPVPILMENAGARVVEFLSERFGPLEHHRIVVFCGKGNNGGDGLVIARQLLTRFRPRALAVVATDHLASFSQMYTSVGGEIGFVISPAMRFATLVIDALLGTGLTGPAHGKAAEFIREMNTGFPNAKIVSVDVPSGQASDTGAVVGDVVRAHATVTFTAPKLCHVLSPACELPLTRV